MIKLNSSLLEEQNAQKEDRSTKEGGEDEGKAKGDCIKERSSIHRDETLQRPHGV